MVIATFLLVCNIGPKIIIFLIRIANLNLDPYEDELTLVSLGVSKIEKLFISSGVRSSYNGIPCKN